MIDEIIALSTEYSRGDCLVVAWYAQAHHMRFSRGRANYIRAEVI